MKTLAALLALACFGAAVFALPTTSEETKSTREGRTLSFGPASYLVPGTYHIQYPGQPAVLMRGYLDLTQPQQPVLQVPALPPSLIQNVLEGIRELVASASVMMPPETDETTFNSSMSQTE